MNFYGVIGKRLADIFFCLFGLLLGLPVFVLLFFLIKFDTRGPIFFIQKRMGLHGREFSLIKFRTMHRNSDKQKLQFEPGDLSRVTRVGRILRMTKLDELPQLINVIKGDMSLVGPRPEVSKYRNKYTGKYAEILSIKPGITDEASVKFSNEEDLLSQSASPDVVYETKILPDKLNLNLLYVEKGLSFHDDVRIIWATVRRVGRGIIFMAPHHNLWVSKTNHNK
jgi:lipopolysaccharide/colanic/teichoic acid biosynthesis glycosyltransferase